MVSVKMGNKNVVDPVVRDPETTQLMLGRFSAIYKKVPLKYIEYLSGRVSL